MRNIHNSNVLEFAIFCIENVAIKIDADPAKVYLSLTERSDILYSYIVPSYDILHTQGKDYIVEDILELMQERINTISNIVKIKNPSLLLQIQKAPAKLNSSMNRNNSSLMTGNK